MLRLVILQLLALVILAAVPSQIHLHEVAKIKTDGAAGFEHFTEGQSHRCGYFMLVMVVARI